MDRVSIFPFYSAMYGNFLIGSWPISSQHFMETITWHGRTTFPQWAAAGDEQSDSWLTIETPQSHWTVLDVMFFCSPFPFKPRLLWVLPPELAADSTGSRSSQAITSESISVYVDHWRGRQQLAMKAWWQLQLARCDRQCGNLRMTAQERWASAVDSVASGRRCRRRRCRRRRRSPHREAASRVAMVGYSFSVLVM